jgi:ribonuclease HI
MTKNLIIYTDGGARGNPGPAALGFVIYDASSQELLFQKGEYLGEQTNNYAEYMALVRSLETAQSLGGEVLDIRMDSQLIVRQMQGLYKIKQPHLRLLADQVFKLLRTFKKFTFTHVFREQNKMADKMVNEALDNQLT